MYNLRIVAKHIFVLQIAKNFVDWLNSIGGNDKNTLSVNSIKKMFQVGFHSHAATSLCVCIKEMPSVPDEVARAKYVKAVSFPTDISNVRNFYLQFLTRVQIGIHYIDTCIETLKHLRKLKIKFLRLVNYCQ